MNYTEKDFAGCLFNPLCKKGMVETYPDLNQIVRTEDKLINHFDMVLRYISALYDKSSPLISQEKDLNYRKEVAAQVAGFDLEQDETFLTLLFQSKNENAVYLVVNFLARFMNDRVWAMIVSAEFIFWEYTMRLMGINTGETSPSEAIKIQDLTHSRLETYYKEFFGDDIDLKKSAQSLRITAESVAKMKKTA